MQDRFKNDLRFEEMLIAPCAKTNDINWFKIKLSYKKVCCRLLWCSK